MAQWTNDNRIYTTEVRVGDIVMSPHFQNLLFRDIMDREPMNGFYVNPWKIAYTPENDRNEMLESMGLVKRTGSVKRFEDYKCNVPDGNRYVVIFTERNTDMTKEFDSVDDAAGHFPLTVKARMLDPLGLWDENGLMITFYMQSSIAKHCINEVILDGFMLITYKNILI